MFCLLSMSATELFVGSENDADTGNHFVKRTEMSQPIKL